MLSGVLPQEQIDEIMSDILGNADRSIWERVSSVNESLLAAYVAKEHPQTAALILSKIKSATAAKIIGHLPAHQRNSIIRRMLSIKPMLDDTMRMLERALHQEFTLNFARNSGADGNARVAEIINKLDRDQIDDVLKSLETTKPQAADALRGQLFTFEDLAKLSPKARTVLFDKVPNERVVLALKGTDQAFRDVILQALGSRVRRMVEQELANGQPATSREVTEARRSITNTALELAARGDIELGAEEEGYVS
jgi:flagellar motor switch protein FliG